MAKVKIIVAYDDNRCIGKDGTLPWNLPEDLKWFKSQTLGSHIVMGRRTWLSLEPRPLPGRINWLLTRQGEWLLEQLEKYPDLEGGSFLINILMHIRQVNKKDIFIIGGGEVYKWSLDKSLVDEILVTLVHGVHNGDTYFPLLEKDKWSVERTAREKKYDRLLFTKVK